VLKSGGVSHSMGLLGFLFAFLLARKRRFGSRPFLACKRASA
jgi:hypothetical protein